MQDAVQRKWRIAPHDQQQIEALQRAAKLPAIVAQLLLTRGIDQADLAEAFLHPKLTDMRDPENFPGLEQAVHHIAEAVAKKRLIMIHGDYDADGITGTAILYRCVKLLGGDVRYYIPNRLADGYGLKDHTLKKFAQEGVALVITVDCGIANFEQAETAKQLGLELIVTDHHTPGKRLPDAVSILHPGLPSMPYPFSGLCGAGVAFKLAWGLCQHKSKSKRVTPQLKTFLLQAVGLAAIGTVADVVPLLDENRSLVHHGLGSLLQQPVPGLSALMDITGLADKKRLGGEDIGFMIAPRLNAAGRLGQAPLAVELLTTDDPARARSLADYLHELNKSRDSIERSVYLAANKQAQAQLDAGSHSALVLAAPGWHKGVIGIVAGRLAEKYHCPVLVASLDEMGIQPGVGSGRSIPGFNLAEALEACDAFLLGHGGHAAAAGFQCTTENMDPFRIAFCEYADTQCDGDMRQADLKIDAEVPLSGLTLQAVEQIERLEPFGQGNRRPLLCSSQIEIREPRTIGNGNKHLALQLVQNGLRLRGVAFGRGYWAEELQQLTEPIAVAFRPVINTFRGQRNVELHLEDWQRAAPQADTPLVASSETSD
ncbi:MAG: single-stranded-DNA-specific exonuclease RecJ [Pirellulales bacterium]|nr:single-stranded-DNA-specific exonuclease RecJ [Pirellulales bacterium]